MEPNNTQYACAVAAICDPKRHRTFMAVPSGQGKSRIIATVVALKKELEGLRDFTIVFPNELLAGVNRQEYADLQNLLRITVSLVVPSPAVVLRGLVNA